MQQLVVQIEGQKPQQRKMTNKINVTETEHLQML